MFHRDMVIPLAVCARRLSVLHDVMSFRLQVVKITPCKRLVLDGSFSRSLKVIFLFDVLQ
jgi:hypothetical protein